MTLAHGGGKVPAPILEAARRQEWDLWPALHPRDALLVSEPPPPGFRDGLATLGLPPPRFITMEEAAGSCADHLFTPFGWNAEAEARGRETGARTDAPDPEVVRRVNAREFGAALDPDTPVEVLRTVRALDRWLSGAPPGRYVAKGRHGFAGIAQQRFALPAGDAEEQRRLRDRLRRLHARHDGLCMEPWHDIVAEWGTLARVTRDGRVGPPRLHRLLSTPDGGFAGACTGPGAVPPDVASALHAAAARIGRALHAEGYHGPFAFDAYRHRTRDGERLRAPSDLNVRLSMAAPVHGLGARHPDRTILFTQFHATSMGFPEFFANSWNKIANLSFDFTSRWGAVVLTPLLTLPRFSVAFFGDDVNDVRTQHRDFLRSFSRRGRTRS